MADTRMKTFVAYIEYDPDTNQYVGIVPGIAGAHTQADNLDQLHSNLKEVLELCLQEQPDLLDDLPRFVGLQQVEIGE